MADQIDLQQLQAELNKTKEKFQLWAATAVKTSQDCKQSHIQNMRSAKRTLNPASLQSAGNSCNWDAAAPTVLPAC